MSRASLDPEGRARLPDDPTEFGWLYAYSPYHHVVDGTCYPATLVTTAPGRGSSRTTGSPVVTAASGSFALAVDETVADKGTVLRSLTNETKFGAIHLKAQYYMKTGYLFPAGVKVPSMRRLTLITPMQLGPTRASPCARADSVPAMTVLEGES